MRLTPERKIKALEANLLVLNDEIEHLNSQLGEKKQRKARYDSSHGGPPLSDSLRERMEAKRKALTDARDMMLRGIEKLQAEKV